ncbi:hypothetical protein AAC387_Pa02g4622 [Persea americana]
MSEERTMVNMEFANFLLRMGEFGEYASLHDRYHMDPTSWWAIHGACAPMLQSLAFKLLMQPSSSSCCQRNWSTYSFVHSMRRNKMTPKRAEDLVFIHSNLRLLSRKTPQYMQGETRMWDIAGDTHDSFEDVGVLEVANLSLDKPELETVVFADDVDYDQIAGDDEAIEVASIDYETTRYTHHSPVHAVLNYLQLKVQMDKKGKGDEKDFDRDSGRSRSGKDSDSYRHAERRSYRNLDDHRTQDDYSRHRRHADDEESSDQRSSWSGRESRSGGHYDHTRQDTEHDRSRENCRNSERYSRDRSDDRGHRKKDTERQTAVIERHRHNNNDLSSERSPSGRRQAKANTKQVKMGERERHRDRGGVRDDKKDHRKSTGDYKNDNASNHEEFREHAESLTPGRDSGASRLKETYKSYKSSSRESNAQNEDRMQKRKHDDQERDNSSPSPGEKISRNDQYQAAGKSPSSSNDVQVTV